MRFGVPDDALRHASQFRHLQAVALAGRAFVHIVQEYNAVVVFDGRQMSL
ncbi:hypothetical protein LCGC14_2852580, partial [marine sediment metagenome]